MQRLKGKVALITGAGSGIGKATALRLAKEGASLALCDLDISQLNDCSKVLPGDTESFICQFDVSDSDACTKAIEDTVAKFGRLDTLCNIAGVALCEHFTKINDADWQRVLNINLSGVFYMSRAANNTSSSRRRRRRPPAPCCPSLYRRLRASRSMPAAASISG